MRIVLTMAAVLVAVAAALVFVMRMDDDPSSWTTGPGGRAERPAVAPRRAGEPAPAPAGRGTRRS